MKSETTESLVEFQNKLNGSNPEVLGAMLSRAHGLIHSADEAERNVGTTLKQQILLAFQWQAQKAREAGEDVSYKGMKSQQPKRCEDFTCDCESHA